MPQVQKTIDYVNETPREFGESGAAVKVIFRGGGEGECTTSRKFAKEHIDALKKLVGVESTFTGEDTKYGFKIEDYPGKPKGKGGGGGGQMRPEWAWETPEQRLFRENRITAATSFKLAMVASADHPDIPPADRLKFAVENWETIFDAICAKVPAPEQRAPTAAPSSAPTNGQQQATSSSAGGRIGEVIALAKGDNLGVVRAKKLARHHLGTDDFDAIPAEQWAMFLNQFASAELQRELGGAPADA